MIQYGVTSNYYDMGESYFFNSTKISLQFAPVFIRQKKTIREKRSKGLNKM